MPFRPPSLLLVRRRSSSTASASASASASDLPPPPLDPSAVLSTLSSYSNDWSRALEFYQWVSLPPHRFLHTPSTVSLAVDILGKHFEFPRALSLLLSSPHPSAALRPLFNRLAAAHLVSDALSLFHRYSSLNPDPLAAFHLLLDALCDHRHALDAHHLFFQNPNPNPSLNNLPLPPTDTKSYNILLRGYLKLGFWAKTREFWYSMDARGVPKDLHSYSIYMNILSKSGKPYKTIQLYKEMKNKGITLDVVAYNTVIMAAGLSEGVDQSVRFYRRMVDSGIQPNSATFNTLIKMLCKAGRVREAYGFLDRMEKIGCGPDVITYHCFFQYLTRPKEILWLFERMVKGRCWPRTDTYTMLMKKFGRWGFLRPVMDVWNAMGEHGCAPDSFAYNALIDALLGKGMVEEARRYDEEMVAKGLSAKRRREFETKWSDKESDGDDDKAIGNVF